MPRFDLTIAGELNLDLILYGLPRELPAERELLAQGMALTLGSSSAIVAHNAAALGCKVGFISCIGDDQFGEIALARLREGGVDISQVRRKPGVGTGLTVILQRTGERNILTYPGTISELSFADLDLDYLGDSRHFHLSSLYLQTKLRPQVPELLQELKRRGLTISLDTNDDPADEWEDLNGVLKYVDVFLPNARELRKAAGADDLQEAMRRVAEKVPLLVVKLGGEGAVAVQGKQRFTEPALKIDVVDPVGAGDSFDAGFLSQYIHGADLPKCLRAGNTAGALSTTRPGGTEAFRDREHRERFLKERAGL